MQRRCCGSVAERGERVMWVSCSAICLGTMLCFWSFGSSPFCVLLFSSPGWLTCLVAPLQKDRKVYKLFSYAAFLFIIFWMTVQAYPVQCRHAWGTRMVGDKTYWGDSPEAVEAQKEAIMQEKDSFYVVKRVGKEERTWYVGAGDTKPQAKVNETQEDSLNTVWGLIQPPAGAAAGAEAGESAEEEQTERIKRWISPLTGDSEPILLKLRGFCTIHRQDKEMPYIFPLRALGIFHSGFTLPCPFWSCVLTEAKSSGKLVYWVAMAAAALLNYVHYRLDCYCGSPDSLCSLPWLLGSGQTRTWWLWFWAALIPLWLVMLIKTTWDAELTELGSKVLTSVWTSACEWFESREHQVAMGVLALASLLIYIYWERVRVALDLDGHEILPHLFPRTQDPLEQCCFQICVWRVDTHAEHHQIHSAGPSVEEDQQGLIMPWSSNRSPVTPSRWTSIRNSIPLLTGITFLGRDDASDMLRTRDGRVPALSVRFYYGLDEIQGTRVVKPSRSDWASGGPVYFQENFKVGLELKPSASFRVEVRDTSAPLGAVALGEVSFDERRLHRQFELSRRSQKEWSQVSVVQVVRMMATPGETPRLQADQANVLKGLGFASHNLSDGGSIWLAFCEMDSSNHESIGCC